MTDSKQYTLKDCKKDMCQMWKWLYEHPNEEKSGFECAHPGYTGSDCAVCEYNEINDEDGCNKCIVNWGSSILFNGKYYIPDCCSSCSPFKKWTTADRSSRSRAIYAKEVYKLALQIKED